MSIYGFKFPGRKWPRGSRLNQPKQEIPISAEESGDKEQKERDDED